uniref:trp operon leader peptide n=1 Tax=Azospirillum brasilense TaxID=192 RepID=LPW_AZOBR|nr:RecName: Full=trp operon leader peptide [Azospirillum brasilense]AAC45140.1 leader peptide [Azospirillum brasilense]
MIFVATSLSCRWWWPVM